jgi:hypothetical protein
MILAAPARRRADVFARPQHLPCVWSCRDRSLEKDWCFPVKLSKSGPDNSKTKCMVTTIAAGGIRSQPRRRGPVRRWRVGCRQTARTSKPRITPGVGWPAASSASAGACIQLAQYSGSRTCVPSSPAVKASFSGASRVVVRAQDPGSQLSSRKTHLRPHTTAGRSALARGGRGGGCPERSRRCALAGVARARDANVNDIGPFWQTLDRLGQPVRGLGQLWASLPFSAHLH